MHTPRTAACLLAASLISGCVSVPRIKADFEGIDNLSTEVSFSSDYLGTESLARTDPGQQPPAYRVGPNDEISVYVLGRDDLGSQIPVNAPGAFGRLAASIVQEDGRIVLPIVGPLNVDGRTLAQVRDLVEDAYRDRIALTNVDIIMQNCHSKPVYVTGAVNVPGTYYLCNDVRTLSDVMAASQWLTTDAYPVGGTLTRGGNTYQLSYPLTDASKRDLDILLQPGDSINFPTVEDGVLPKVHVFGMVETQGTFPIPPGGLTLLDALGLAEGFRNDTADTDGIYLMRLQDGGTAVTYKVKLEELVQGPAIPLVANDRIYVAPRGLARWDTWWRLAIPFTLSVRTIQN